MTGSLTDLEWEILAIEAGHWRWEGAKEPVMIYQHSSAQRDREVVARLGG